MHLYDIEDAIHRGDALGLQHAFRILIDFPHLGLIEGARSAAKLDGLFGQVTAGMHLDQTTMPEKLRQAMERVTSVLLDPGMSYAQGAIIAFEFRDRWRALYIDAVSAAA